MPNDSKTPEGCIEGNYPLLGKLALKYSTITRDQLETATRVFKQSRKTSPELSFDKILMDHNMVIKGQIVLLRVIQGYWEARFAGERFGSIAIMRGYLTERQVAKALEVQKRAFMEAKISKRIGDILVDQGVLTMDQCANIIAEQNDSASGLQQNTEDSSRLEQAYARTREEDQHFITIAVKKGFAKPEEIDRALLKQESEYIVRKLIKSVGDILVEEKSISRDQCDSIIQTLSTNKRQKRSSEVAVQPPNNEEIPMEYLFAEAIHGDDQIPDRDNAVRRGDIIARIGTKGTPPLSEAKILKICGEGVRFSEKNMSIIATTGGEPFRSIDGRLNVLSKTIIHEDADLRAGPISGMTNISIAGTLTGAYPVTGGSLAAVEIRGADVRLMGGANIAIGITDSTIITQGDVRAKYILNSKIYAFGDVIVENEIIDSTILTSGRCTVKKSRIIASDISAKKGVSSIGIGSDVTEPCNITAGAEDHINNELRIIEENIADLLDKLKEEIDRRKELELKRVPLMKKKEKLEEINKKAVNILAALEKQEQNKKTISLMGEVKAKGDAASRSISRLENENKVLVKKIVKAGNAIKIIKPGIKSDVKKLLEKKEMFSRWAKKEQGAPEIRIKGPISSGTVLNGTGASITLEKSYRNLLVKEACSSDPLEPQTMRLIEKSGQ